MKTKEEIKEAIRCGFGDLLEELDTAADSADRLVHAVRCNGITGTRYVQLLRAIEKVRDRAYALDKTLESP